MSLAKKFKTEDSQAERRAAALEFDEFNEGIMYIVAAHSDDNTTTLGGAFSSLEAAQAAVEALGTLNEDGVLEWTLDAEGEKHFLQREDVTISRVVVGSLAPATVVCLLWDAYSASMVPKAARVGPWKYEIRLAELN